MCVFTKRESSDSAGVCPASRRSSMPFVKSAAVNGVDRTTVQLRLQRPQQPTGRDAAAPGSKTLVGYLLSRDVWGLQDCSEGGTQGYLA